MAGSAVILALLAVSVLGGLLVGPEQHRTGSFPPRLPPGREAFLGTDALGQSIAIQLAEATPKSLQIGLIAASLGTFLGALIGFASGYFGGIVDVVLGVLIDIFLSVPSLLFLILIAALVRGVGIQVMALVIGFFAWAYPARQVRAQALSLRERAFVHVARFSGMSGLEIIFRELMPQMLQWLGANFVVAFIWAVLTETGLSILGLGSQTEMTLGMMIYWALNYGAILESLWWWWLFPVLILICLFLSLYLVHLGFDEVSNPRLRGRA